LRTTVPYLRQRSDSYWEIVWIDPVTAQVRRKSTKTKVETDAQKKLDAFRPDAAPIDPNAPRLRQRTDGYWETVYKEDNGKTRRHSHRTKVERDAEPLHEAFVKELARPEIPARPTVGWVVDKYYEYICREKSESTSGPMAANVGPLKEHLGDMYWDEVVQDTVDQYIQWRTKRPRWTAHEDFSGQYGTASRNTACKDLRVLRAALNRAKRNRYISAAPDFEIVSGPPVRKTDTWLTMEEMERMIAACDPAPVVVNGIETGRIRNREHIEVFLLLSLATGARKEAILSLTWDQIFIPWPKVREWIEVTPTPVQNANGKIVVPKRTRRAIFEEPVLDYSENKHIKGAYIDFGVGSGNKRCPQIPIGQNWRLMNYLLFADRSQPYVVSYKGERVQSLKKGLAQVAKEAGIDKVVTHHTMKRTAITHMIRGGVPLSTVAEAVNTTEAVLKKHYNMHRPDIEEAFGDLLSIP